MFFFGSKAVSRLGGATLPCTPLDRFIHLTGKKQLFWFVKKNILFLLQAL
jgi:hypothetical protein